MKKKSAIGFSLLTILSLSFFAGVFSHSPAASVKATVGTYSRSQSTYYTSGTNRVTSTKYGSSLLSTLHELMYETHESYNTYGELWTYTKETDYDIDNPDNIILLYSRQSVDGNNNDNVWNREHVWCKSLSGGLYGSVTASTTGAGSDLHHLRPASTAYNSSRGNVPYGVVATHNATTRFEKTDCYSANGSFEPADYIKGDVARVLMYTYMHYSSEVGGTSTKTGALSITNIVNKNTAQAAWDLLMDWNESDPVDYQEMIRNNKCAYLLGNYNPFIDHPEFARMIWDDSSDQQAGLFFQTSYKTVTVGGRYTNTASAYGNVSSSGDVYYTSDNPDIATVDSSTGQVTGVSNGVVRIKARATINGITKISYHFAVVGSGYTPKDTLNAEGIVYTPISSSSLVASKKIGSETISYNNTYNGTSQMTGGKSATLTINNFPGTVSSIILYMHSNAKEGSGSINVTIGGSSYKSIPDQTFKQIYGSFTQAFVPIDVTNPSASKKTGTIVITISCSANSFFFQKAVIDYEERVVKKATGISISPSSTTLTPGEDCLLSSVFSPSDTTLKTNTWTSSDESVATVNKYGLVRAIGIGNATITATTSDGSSKTGTATITVASSVVPTGDPTVTGVTVSPSSTTLDVTSNPTTTLTATVNGTNNPSQAVTWSVASSNPSGCVSVDNSGVVTANNTGSAVIRATSDADNTFYGECTITVTNTPKTLSSISLNTTNVQKTFTVGDAFNYTGLVVTATFNTGSETVTPTSVLSPDMSTSGNKTVTVSYTFGGNTETDTYQITVNEAQSSEPGNYTWNLAIASYNTPTSTTQVTWDSDCASMVADKNNATTNANNYLGGDSNNRTSSRFYKNSKLTFTPKTDYEITSVVYTATSNAYASALSNSTWTNATASVSTTTVTITPTDGTLSFYAIISDTTGSTSVLVNYIYTPSKTLSSISLDTTNVQKSFNVNDTFNYTGLVVTANYSNSTSATVTPTSVSSPDMSTTGNKTVTVTYTENNVSKNDSYSITVSSDPSLNWTAPSINTYAGRILTSEAANSWGVTYNNGSGSTTNPTYGQFSVKLNGTTITLPYTWQASDDNKTLCVSYSSLTTSTTNVSIVQNLNAINKTQAAESATSALTFTSQCGGSGTANDGKTWTVTSDAAESNFDNTKGVHYGTGSSAVEYIELVSDSFVSCSTIESVVVNASGASGKSGYVSVTVGGNAFDEVQTFNDTAGNKTFSVEDGMTAGRIVVRIYKTSKTNGAIYCKSVSVTYKTNSTTENIANVDGHENAQRAVVKFAKAFNAAMDTTSGCTSNMSSAWSTASAAWTTFLSDAAALGSTEEAYAMDLISNASAIWTPGTDSDYMYCLERALATYDKCVSVHGMTAFMSDVRPVGRYSFNSPLKISSSQMNSIFIITLISAITILSVGGYFFFRRKKED